MIRLTIEEICLEITPDAGQEKKPVEDILEKAQRGWNLFSSGAISKALEAAADSRENSERSSVFATGPAKKPRKAPVQKKARKKVAKLQTGQVKKPVGRPKKTMVAPTDQEYMDKVREAGE